MSNFPPSLGRQRIGLGSQSAATHACGRRHRDVTLLNLTAHEPAAGCDRCRRSRAAGGPRSTQSSKVERRSSGHGPSDAANATTPGQVGIRPAYLPSSSVRIPCGRGIASRTQFIGAAKCRWSAAVNYTRARRTEGPWVSVLLLQYGGAEAAAHPRRSRRALREVLARTRVGRRRPGFPVARDDRDSGNRDGERSLVLGEMA